MTEIAQLVAGTQVVDDRGGLSPRTRFWEWQRQVTNLQIRTGSGSPEGVVEAPVTTLYMNTAGTAGSILYIKKLPGISGDRSQGWILV